MVTLRRLHASHPGAKLRCLEWPPELWVRFDGIEWKDNRGFCVQSLVTMYQSREAEVFKEEVLNSVRWLNAYGPDCFSALTSSRQEADSVSLNTRVACIRLEINWRIGQFDGE